MHKYSISLLLSFILGVVLTFLACRWFGSDRQVVRSQSGDAPISASGVSRLSLKASTVSPTESLATVATEPYTNPSTWLKAWVAAGAPPEQRDQAMRMVELWADTDARSALDFVANASRFPRRLDALTIPLAKLGEQDITTAVIWMKSHLTLGDRTELAPTIARRIGTNNPALALEFAFTPNLPVDRGTLAYLITGLVRTQPAQALSYFGKLSDEGRLQAAGSFAGAWFETDHEAAVKWCAAQRDSVFGRAALKGLIEAVAMTTSDQLSGIINQLAVTPEDFAAWHIRFRTPDEALVLLPYLSDQGRRQAVEGIVRDEMQRDPVLALKLARESLPPDTSGKVIHDAWAMWHRSDAKAALDWAEGIDDATLKLSLLGEPVDPLLKMDPAQFLAEADRAGLGSRKPEQINQAIYAIAENDPRAAAAWIDRMPQTVSTEIVRDVACEWLGRDEHAAWSWINSLPSSTTRDAALV